MWFEHFFLKSANCSNQVSSLFFLSILMNSAYSYNVKEKYPKKSCRLTLQDPDTFSQWESIMLSTSWEVGGSFQKLYFVRDLTTMPITVVFAIYVQTVILLANQLVYHTLWAETEFYSLNSIDIKFILSNFTVYFIFSKYFFLHVFATNFLVHV